MSNTITRGTLPGGGGLVFGAGGGRNYKAGSQNYRAGSQIYGSQNYRAGDSMIYHQSMFLKRLSHAYPEADKKHGGWRAKLGELLESKPEQIIIFSLIVLDLLVICAQLFIIDPRENCNKNNQATEFTYLDNNVGTKYAYQDSNIDTEFMARNSSHSDSHHADPHEEHVLEVAAQVLNFISLSILGVLGLEIVLLLIAFDIDFFKQPLYILDALVIGASLFIELKEEDFAGSLLIFFRLWRIVRIVHGVAMSVQEKNEERIKILEEEVEHLTKDKTSLSTKLDYLKKKYKKLVATNEEEEDQLPKIASDVHEDTPRPPSVLESSDAALRAATHKTVRVTASASADTDDDDDDDEDEQHDHNNRNAQNDQKDQDNDEVVVGINDDVLPLLGASYEPEYNTFKK